MVLPCIKVKRFEESMFSCTWPRTRCSDYTEPSRESRQ